MDQWLRQIYCLAYKQPLNGIHYTIVFDLALQKHGRNEKEPKRYFGQSHSSRIQQAVTLEKVDSFLDVTQRRANAFRVQLLNIGTQY